MEGDHKRSAAESLNQGIKKLLCQYYDKLESVQMELCLCKLEKEPPEGVLKENKKREWECISGDEIARNEIETLLSMNPKFSAMDGKFLGKANKYIVYDGIREGVRDSCFVGWNEPRDVRWIFLANVNKKSVSGILQIVAEELMLQFDDLLYMELIAERIKDNYWKSIELLQKDGLCKHYLGILLDKDELNRRYVKQALASECLPDWKVFLQLSSMFYEKRSIQTRIYFNSDSHLQFSLRFLQDEKIFGSSPDYRMIRKMMETAGSDGGLVVGNQNIRGIVKKSPEMEKSDCVEFLEHMVWQLKKGSEVLFKYRKGDYKLPELESSDDAQKEIEILKKYAYNDIAELAEEVRKMAPHGTSLIFMEEAALKYQVSRLSACRRAIKVKPFNLAGRLKDVKNIFAIDGAVLLDFSCNCVAIGVIVDGEALLFDEGAAYGARHNSVLSYVQGIRKKAECIAVIISEDGTVKVDVAGSCSASKESDKADEAIEKIVHSN